MLATSAGSQETGPGPGTRRITNLLDHLPDAETSG